MERASKSNRTRERILDAAAGVLAERGYAAFSLAAVAERAGLQAGSLYYHFDSKDELVYEAVRIGTDNARRAVERAVAELEPGHGPLDALTAAITAHLTSVLAHGTFTRASIRSYGQLPPALAERQRESQREYGATWRELIGAASRAGAIRADVDLRTTRLLLLGAMNWSIEWFDAEGPIDPEQLAQQLTTIVLDGLRPAR